MSQRPVSPCRLRVRATSKRGRPQSSSSSADGAVRIVQRVSAALGSARAQGRSRIAVTPLFCAPSTSRREATRSRILGLPGTSAITAPSAAQLSASAPARKASVALAALKSRRVLGSMPNSARPVGASAPCSRAEKSCTIHSRRLCPAARRARPAAKPDGRAHVAGEDLVQGAAHQPAAQRGIGRGMAERQAALPALAQDGGEKLPRAGQSACDAVHMFTLCSKYAGSGERESTGRGWLRHRRNSSSPDLFRRPINKAFVAVGFHGWPARAG